MSVYIATMMSEAHDCLAGPYNLRTWFGISVLGHVAQWPSEKATNHLMCSQAKTRYNKTYFVCVYTYHWAFQDQIFHEDLQFIGFPDNHIKLEIMFLILMHTTWFLTFRIDQIDGLPDHMLRKSFFEFPCPFCNDPQTVKWWCLFICATNENPMKNRAFTASFPECLWIEMALIFSLIAKTALALDWTAWTTIKYCLQAKLMSLLIVFTTITRYWEYCCLLVLYTCIHHLPWKS